MRRCRLARAVVLILGLAPLAVIAVAFAVTMTCRRDCPTDIYVGIPFVLLGALVWLGVALLVARAISRRGGPRRR
ncbi:MAG: hypothetical protein QOH83_754 [Solirubrobacteraceae bacterium]|jgi:hypothetical protein|nr:hypothetical protein [Solirubrobacteraceae bacterium]